MLRKYLQNLANSKILRSDKVSSTLQSLGWKYEKGKLHKHFQFGCYEDSSFFISRYTAYCQKINHTPKWKNVYNNVWVQISPYQQLSKNQELSVRDIQLARYLDRIGGLDLELSSQRDYYRHDSIALSTKQLYNDQKKRTQLGRNLLSIQSQSNGHDQQHMGINDFLSQVPYSKADEQLNRLQIQGKHRIEELSKRNFTRMMNYNQGFVSQQYLSDPELDMKQEESSQGLIQQGSRDVGNDEQSNNSTTASQ